MNNIYLTRHGSTLWNLEKRLQGSNDSELTDEGIFQAKLLAKRIKDLNISKIYTSPIKRAYRTAEIIKGDMDIDVICKDGFKEISFGEYEGSIESELLNENRGYEIGEIFKGNLDVKAPGGESLRELYDRVSSTLDVIFDNIEGDILIVTHATTLKAILCYFEGKLEFRDLIMGQATLTKVVKNDNKFIIEYMNDDSHLEKNNKKIGW